jgi:hypothetical protein
MLKKLLIPAFAFTVAVVGCSSSSTPSSDGGAGKTGSAGSTAGSTGSAGSTAGTTGTAGATAGSTGTAGATAGTTGTAGATAGSTGTAGAAGSTAGSTGTAGTDGGAAAGHDGGTAGTDGGGAAGSDGGAAGSDGGTALPICTSNTGDSAAMSAADYCAILLATCGTGHAGDATQEACVTKYTAATAAQKMCRSYHVCNAKKSTTAGDITAHCGHAAGETMCN